MGFYNYFLGIPDDDGEGGGLIYRLGAKMLQLSCIAYLVVEFGGYTHTYYFGYNMFLWIAILGLVVMVVMMVIMEEVPEKDASVLDEEINEAKSKLEELEKEKAKQVPDFSKYNEKMNEQPPVV